MSTLTPPALKPHPGTFFDWLSYFNEKVWEVPTTRVPLKDGQTNVTLRERVGSVVWSVFREIPPLVASFSVASIFSRTLDTQRKIIWLGLGSLGVNLLCETISHGVQYQHERSNKGLADFYTKAEHSLYLLGRTLRSGFYLRTVGVIAHEFGHAFTALALFKNPMPRIELGLLFETNTSVNAQALSQLGDRLGWKNSLAALSMGGPLLGLVHDLALLTFAHYCKDPSLSVETHMTVGLNGLMTAGYAVSALWRQGAKNHDFVQFQKLTGVDPVAAAIFFLAVPVLWKLAMTYYDHLDVRFNVKRKPVIHKMDHSVE